MKHFKKFIGMPIDMFALPPDVLTIQTSIKSCIETGVGVISSYSINDFPKIGLFVKVDDNISRVHQVADENPCRRKHLIQMLKKSVPPEKKITTKIVTTNPQIKKKITPYNIIVIDKNGIVQWVKNPRRCNDKVILKNICFFNTIDNNDLPKIKEKLKTAVKLNLPMEIKYTCTMGISPHKIQGLIIPIKKHVQLLISSCTAKSKKGVKWDTTS